MELVFVAFPNLIITKESFTNEFGRLDQNLFINSSDYKGDFKRSSHIRYMAQKYGCKCVFPYEDGCMNIINWFNFYNEKDVHGGYPRIADLIKQKLV